MHGLMQVIRVAEYPETVVLSTFDQSTSRLFHQYVQTFSVVQFTCSCLCVYFTRHGL